jgi:hypothetical protein
MKKNNIVQFVCFVTQLEFDEFVTKWDHYAKQFITDPGATVLQEAATKSRYKYVSQHEHREDDIRFAFMKGRSSDHFADQKVKVLQAGGYTPLQTGNTYHDENTDVKILAFIGHSDNDLDFYRQLAPAHSLNIYEAYYESCTYGYILEYYIPETNAADLLPQLKARPGVEIAVYKECLVPQV